MRTILPLALLAVTACYTPRAVDPAPEYGYGSLYGVEPLEASLYYDEHNGYAYFDVTRSAHVAMFALRPGGGMEMIYPAIGIGTRTQFTSGRHSVRTSASPFRMAGNWSVAFGEGPMYILLVASDDPLDVGPFRATGTMAWLNRSSITYNPYVALEALVGEVVPRPNTSAWTTAMHVVWPVSSWPRSPQRRYLAVQCDNGMIVTAPIEALLGGYPICPEQVQQPPAVDSLKTKERAPVQPRPGEAPPGWMSTKIADTDLRDELRRIRELNGKRDPGVLAIRPFPAMPIGERSRPGVGPRSTDWPAGIGERERTRSRPAARASAERSRPVARPSTPERTRPVRPEARPARPAPKPAPPPKPSKPPKPTKPVGSGGGGSGS